ncbi:MAG: type 2 isopentenyl-diphosphate Delta-isomerase [Firmicutes bacterium]|nr:type 2 isopentenyl-diphosphate Delta-isomerase [Bacillota bacterium]
MSKFRAQRKHEHLALALQGSRCSFATYFDDIQLPHDCLTTVNPGEVDLSGSLCGYPVDVPFFINAITGGTLRTMTVNMNLAQVAKRFQVPMAVGSQTAALDNKRMEKTFRIVRKLNPHGLIMANVSASTPPALALRAVDMLDAQILQLHLNPAQEFIMPEGDRPKSGLLNNIAEICSRASVPVIVKEVGFGILPAQYKQLTTLGVQGIDISGTGGTNFAVIEGRRNCGDWWRPFTNWGYPTPVCVALCAPLKTTGVDLVASGGITDGLKSLKLLALGADSTGIAGHYVQLLIRQGPEAANLFTANLIRQLRVGLALMGLKSIGELRNQKPHIGGKLAALLACYSQNKV